MGLRAEQLMRYLTFERIYYLSFIIGSPAVQQSLPQSQPFEEPYASLFAKKQRTLKNCLTRNNQPIMRILRVLAIDFT
jgi:hypothetical protein